MATLASAGTLAAQVTPPPTTAPTVAASPLLRVAPSGRGTTAVTLTAGEDDPAPPKVIKVDYGQPHLRGRVLHTDSLVPYDRPWRLGANDPTTLTTDVDLVLGSATLAKGTYVLMARPARAGWKLIVQKSVGQMAMPHNPANDVATLDLRRRDLATPLESLTMWLIPSRQPGAPRGELRIAWGTVELSTDWQVK